MMYSMRISSITFTVSFAGLRSSPKPYMRLRTKNQLGGERSVRNIDPRGSCEREA